LRAALQDAPAFSRHLLGLLAALGLLACNHPPVREVAAGESLLDQARSEGAEAYAPERWKEAQEALKTAKIRLQEKDYRGALSSATEVAERSRAALEAVVARKAEARHAVEADRSMVEAVLGELVSLRGQAAQARVPEAAFREVEGAEEGVREGLREIGSQLGEGDLLAAERGAEELKARAAPLPTAFRQARVKWEAAHSKHPGRPRR